MELDKIIAINGRPGLYKMLTQTRTGVVAESLIDGKRVSTSINNRLSVLSEIQIYGLQGETPLSTVFEKMLKYEAGQPCRVKPKAAADALEAYFFEVFDDYDEDRVYPSDIKKIIQWYNILLAKKILTFTAPTENLANPTESQMESEPDDKPDAE